MKRWYSVGVQLISGYNELSIIININTTVIQGLWILKQSLGCRHVLNQPPKSAVSLPACTSLRSVRSLLLPGCKRCWLLRAGEAGFLPISAGKASINNNNQNNSCHHVMLFKSYHFFYAQLGLDVCPVVTTNLQWHSTWVIETDPLG